MGFNIKHIKIGWIKPFLNLLFNKNHIVREFIDAYRYYLKAKKSNGISQDEAIELSKRFIRILYMIAPGLKRTKEYFSINP